MKRAILLALALPAFELGMPPFDDMPKAVQELRECKEVRAPMLNLESAINYYRQNESPRIKRRIDLKNEAFIKEVQDALYFHGYLGGFWEGVLDESTSEAVAIYKRKNALSGSGINAEFVRHISTPSNARVKLLEEALGLSQNFDFNNTLYINIPEFKMRYYFDNQQQMEMKVIVGSGEKRPKKDKWLTFVQKGTLEYATVNPYWDVPAGDLTEETRGDLRKSSYLRKSMEQHIGGKWVPVDNAVSGRKFRQLPGPGNALGRIEYSFNGGYGELLHGTPRKHLFKSNVRNFSHGCMRLEDEIAVFNRFQELGVIDKGVNLQELLDRIEDNRYRTKKVQLTLPVDVRVVYLRAWVEDGENGLLMTMPPDIYDYKKSFVP